MDRRLPEGELTVMQAVWRCEPPVSRTDIENILEDRYAATTILTVLTRLCEKGFLALERRGRTNYYTPLVPEKDYLAGESRRLLDRLFGGSVAAFATSLADSGVSREELAALRRMLEKGEL